MGTGLHQLTAVAMTAAFMPFRLAAHQKATKRVNQRIAPHARQRTDHQRMVAPSRLIAGNQLFKRRA